MKRLRTLVVMHYTLVPPDSLEGHSAKDIEEWRTEFDVVSTLKKSGHEVRCLGISDSVEELRSVITEWKPEIVFNLLEEFDGIVTYDQHVVAFLELLRQPYTGCNPRGLLLARDKPLSKQLLSYHRIPSPQFAVFRRGIKLRLPRKIKYPLFVKSTTEIYTLSSTWSPSSSCCASRTPAAIHVACCSRVTSRSASSCCPITASHRRSSRCSAAASSCDCRATSSTRCS